jgi:TrmH family RNA methyltransferase
MEPEKSGNVGAVARAMANFGFDKLVIINPKCNPLDDEAMRRAKHSQQILKKAKIAKKDILKKFDIVIATTAIKGDDYNVARCSLNLEELKNKITKKAIKNTTGKSAKNSKNNIGILFGREGIGLTNEEVEQADFTVTIPTSEKYKTMNLSHSVAVVLYELSKTSKIKNAIGKSAKNSKKEKNDIYATQKDKQILFGYINKTIDKSDEDKSKKSVQKIVWKRVIGKAMITKRECFSLCGFFRGLK